MTIRERLFGNDDSDSEEDTMTEETTDETEEESETQEDAQEAYEEARDSEEEPAEEEEEEPEEVTLMFTRELSFDYTEHDATVTFMDGSEEEYTFDKMNKSSNDIVLKDYTDELDGKRGFGGRAYAEPKGALAFATIERGNMKSFETTERRDEEKTQEFTDSRTVPRPEAEEYVEENEDAFIKEDQEEDEE